MPSAYLAANISPEVLGDPANAKNLSGLSANVPAKSLVNVTGLPDDMFAKYSKGPTAQLMPADPKKGYSTPYYAAYTNDGDMAGAVMVADGQKVRLVDKTTGDVVFEGVGPEGARLATSVANGISQDLGRKAAWAIQKPTDEGGWVSMAEERYDPKKQSVLGKLADFALPILGAILMPVTGGMSAAIAAGLGSAAGSALSSLAQGRSVEETLKRAALAGVTAGVGAKVVPMIGSALAPKSAMTDMLVAAQNKAVEMGLSTQPFSAALSAEAAKTAAEHPIRSALSKAFDATTGAVDDAASGVRSVVKGALSTATDAGKKAVEKVAGNALAGTVAPVSVVGAGAPGAASGALAGAGTSATLSNALTGSSGQPALRGDAGGDTLSQPGEGTTVDELIVEAAAKLNPATWTTLGPVGALNSAMFAKDIANGLDADLKPVDQFDPEQIAEGVEKGVDYTVPTAKELLSGPGPSMVDKALEWAKAHPDLVAKGIANGIAPLIGAGAAAGGGSTTGGGIPPGFATAGTPGSLPDKFRAQLPAPSGPFGNLAARDVAMTPEEWKTYGARPEQSFFANVPIRPSGIIDTSKRAPVNPGLNPAEAEPGFKAKVTPDVRVAPGYWPEPNSPTQPVSGANQPKGEAVFRDVVFDGGSPVPPGWVDPYLPATGGQPLGAQGAASSQPVPGFNPGAVIPYYMRDDGFNRPAPQTKAPFAVALDKLRDRQAPPLPAPSKGFKVGGFAVRGPGTGRSDDIPARLSDGEYVIDAETVALLGDGSSQAGSKRLDEFRANIRKHKGRQLAKGKFSHDARKPEAYLHGGQV